MKGRIGNSGTAAYGFNEKSAVLLKKRNLKGTNILDCHMGVGVAFSQPQRAIFVDFLPTLQLTGTRPPCMGSTEG